MLNLFLYSLLFSGTFLPLRRIKPYENNHNKGTIKMRLTKQDKQELNRWFENPVETKGCTIQLVGATEKEWEKFCVLADTYLEMKRMEQKQ